MKVFYVPFLLFVITFQSDSSKIEEDIDVAFQNAKKGIYWALSNMPDKKTKIENELIAEDKLYSSVSLEKQINGVVIESTGYFLSNSVSIKIYKSFDNLEKEGYIKKGYY